MDSSIYIYLLGFLAQGLFSARLLVQWIMSERAKKVVSPTIFWILSLIASFVFFIYGWLRDDFSLMLGQVIGYFVYIWNIGAKGGWKKIPQPWRALAVSALMLTPAVGLGAMAGHWGDISQNLFHNEQIPLWMVIYGSAGQVIFSLRFAYQFLYSKKRSESILPKGFWIISLAGSLIIVSYAFIRHDWALALGQTCGLVTYSRNLMIAVKSERTAGKTNVLRSA
ncbi:MAG: lipid-A-disaccharide synthase N-terminal domain-containing protein [Bacteroidales bacterium]|nr:lipid-A-disaccharide synthase N-terminal domain-containing protein [Bacteroidales bacterium]